MAHYAAVISLQRTIERFLDSSHFSILPSDQEIIKLLDEKLDPLRRVLNELDHHRNDISSKRAKSLDEQIRDATYKLQDALDFYVSDQFLTRSESLRDEDSELLPISLDVSDEVLRQEIYNFADMVKKKSVESARLCTYSFLEEEEEEDDDDDDDGDDDSPRVGFVGTEMKMVGLYDEFSRVKEYMLKPARHVLRTFAICGMAGIGKTTIAKKIYHDPEVCNHFNCRLWVTIGQKCQFTKIMLGLLAQLDYDVDNIQTDGHEKLGNYLCTSLRRRRYLIVLDDVWDARVFIKLEEYLPKGDKQSQILATTRLQQVARFCPLGRDQTLRFLNEEESWCLLREKVFGEQLCPYQLEKAGKKIAKNCDGLPLLIVTVADLLSKAEKTLAHWTKIADDKISSILLKSYNYLPQDPKACFLYMGIFPSKCDIPASKLYNLWIAEDISSSITRAKDILYDLVSSNIVLKYQDAAIGGIKTASLHFSFWHACVKQSQKEKFLHVISSFADISKEGVKSQRRLCTHNSVLFGIKEVYNLVESISSARSLICGGPNHQYPVPICFGLRLLKVLDVLSARFYKFPIEVLKLIHLKYLALTYNGKIPPSISKLWNLEYLILCRHLSIKFLGDCSYLPVEIWNLQNLTHLQVTGSCLPYLCDVLLPKLLKLSGISAHNCTKEIFGSIPNLQKLGIQIELAPNSDAIDPLCCFDHLFLLYQLESLKCVIVNPNPARPQLIAPPTSATNFPSCLKKLCLSGFGYPWDYMRVIGKLLYLRVLKLRSYAFRGREWKVYEDEFRELKYLLLEDLDLVHMTFHGIRGFPKLDKLIIKHCYKFKTIPFVSCHIIELVLVDSPLIEKYIQKNRKATWRLRNTFKTIPFITHSSGLHVHSSWDDGERKV